MEHKSCLCSYLEYKLIDAFTPKKKKYAKKPAISWEYYHIPSTLTEELKNKIAGHEPRDDLCSMNHA